ncbi:MAG TPA: hypothetical protein VJ907_02500 [Halanaerobiales bacterium]|nr:hypothetical protein [Halanaerobiales bacterium]
MLPIGITLVVLGIALSFGLMVLEDTADNIGDDNCAGYWNSTSTVCQVNTTNTTALSTNSFAFNGSQDAIEGVAELPSKMPIIVTVIIAALIIGILVRYLMRA